MAEHEFDLPPAWAQAAERILAARGGRLLVIGQTDVGKSAWCGYLCARLLHVGIRPAVVDADVGQKDIGPPASVTLGYPAPSRDLGATPPAAFAFVGSTNPITHMGPVAAGVARLTGAADAPVTIVNTPGAIHGPGRALLKRLIAAVRPDIVVALEARGELAPVLDPPPAGTILRLPRSPEAKRKSATRRRAARQRRFADYFAAAVDIRLNLDSLALHRSAVRPDRALVPSLLCGLADGRGNDLGLGLVREIDPGGRTVTLLTPVPRERIAAVSLGDLYLTPDGQPCAEAHEQG